VRFPHAVWSQGPDQGMSDAINKGFSKAQGNWVMWLNADDQLHTIRRAAAHRIAGHPAGLRDHDV
jgi:glycosyltransferase involved in cell wall biosynthesis